MKHSFRFIYDYFCYFNRLWNNRRYEKWKRVRRGERESKKEYNNIFSLSWALFSSIVRAYLSHLLLQIPGLLLFFVSFCSRCLLFCSSLWSAFSSFPPTSFIISLPSKNLFPHPIYFTVYEQSIILIWICTKLWAWACALTCALAFALKRKRMMLLNQLDLCWKKARIIYRMVCFFLLLSCRFDLTRRISTKTTATAAQNQKQGQKKKPENVLN